MRGIVHRDLRADTSTRSGYTTPTICGGSSGFAASLSDDAQSPHLFEAVQEQLGLKLTAVKGMVSAMVVDSAEKPAVD